MSTKRNRVLRNAVTILNERTSRHTRITRDYTDHEVATKSCYTRRVGGTEMASAPCRCTSNGAAVCETLPTLIDAILLNRNARC